MAKYRFRLATLRKVRESHRDELRGKLAEAFRAAQLLEEQQLAVAKEIVDLQDIQRRTTSSANTNVNALMESQRYQTVLRSQQSTLREQAKLLAAEVERRRQIVINADQQVRVLEKLDKRQRLQHELAQSRVEAREMDEIASHSRKVNQ